MIDSNYPALSRALVDSLLWRTTVALAGMVDAAWRTSITANIVNAIRISNARTIAVVAAAALAITVAVQFAIPSYVRPGLPVAWPLTVVAILAAIALWPSAFADAWPSSLLGRFFRIVKGG